MTEQLDLLAWSLQRGASHGRKAAKRRTTRGLAKAVRIRVKGNGVRGADRGEVVEVFEELTPPRVRYRSDKNGGLYVVELDRVRLDKPPRVKGVDQARNEAA